MLTATRNRPDYAPFYRKAEHLSIEKLSKASPINIKNVTVIKFLPTDIVFCQSKYFVTAHDFSHLDEAILSATAVTCSKNTIEVSFIWIIC